MYFFKGGIAMSNNMEDAYVVKEFANIVVSRIKDVMLALPAIVPQSKEDELLFKKGMKAMDDIVYELEHADNIREYGRVIDIRRVLQDFDSDSIKTLDSKINNSARASIEQLTNMTGSLDEPEYEYYEEE